MSTNSLCAKRLRRAYKELRVAGHTAELAWFLAKQNEVRAWA